MDSPEFSDVEKAHWNANWSSPIDRKPLSRLNIANNDIDRLFRREFAGRERPRVIEIGSAPGKMLLHVERTFGARCTGIDYSDVGCRAAESFLAANGSAATMICRDVLDGPIAGLDADFVYSIGVVEHFGDPTAMVRAHLDLVRPRGKAVIILPNYSGPNAALQRRLDPANLAIHNLATMDPAYWTQRMDKWPDFTLRAFRTGRPSPWMFSFARFGTVGRLFSYAANFAAFAVPRGVRIMPSMMAIVYERSA